MDAEMFNYDSNANTDVGCIPKMYGCMDNTARNYDANANIEDNSCEWNCTPNGLARDEVVFCEGCNYSGLRMIVGKVDD